MTENSSTDVVQSRQACFVRCCLKATVKKVAFSEKRIYYYLYVYDTNFVELAKQEWDIATDGSVLSLTDEDGKTSEYQQVTLEEAADIMTYPAFLVG